MKKDYFTRLTYAARWRMPPAEAEEFLTDYREILEENPRTEEELLRELGRPEEAVRLAAQRGDYYRWLGMFAAMALCLLLPALCLLVPGVWWLFDGAFTKPVMESFCLIAGILLSLFWFRKRERGVLLKPLLISMLALFLLCGWVNWLIWRALPGISIPWGTLGPAACVIYMVLGVISALAGLFGLVMARISGRRWRGLYVLALAVAVLTCCVLTMMRSMDPTQPWSYYLARLVRIIVIGLIGTGVSLC